MFSVEELEERLNFALRCYGVQEAPSFRRSIFERINCHLLAHYGFISLPANFLGYRRLREVIDEGASKEIFDYVLIRLFFWELAVLTNFLTYYQRHPDRNPSTELSNIIGELKQLMADSKTEIVCPDKQALAEFHQVLARMQPDSSFTLENYFLLVDMISFLRQYGCPLEKIEQLTTRLKEFHELVLKEFSWRFEISPAREDYDENPVGYFKSKAVPN